MRGVGATRGVSGAFGQLARPWQAVWLDDLALDADPFRFDRSPPGDRDRHPPDDQPDAMHGADLTRRLSSRIQVRWTR